MSVLLTLLCHAPTQATRGAAFPADEQLEPDDMARAASLAGSVRRVDAAWTSPARRARQTAVALQLDAAVEHNLRDLDVGCWAGRSMADIEASDPQGLAGWIADVRSIPHGGESISSLLDRIAIWLSALDQDVERVVAVTHASVIRAAIVAVLGARPEAFWRIDIAPLCRVSLRGHRGTWTLRSIGVDRP